jgi:hypothetical protein
VLDFWYTYSLLKPYCALIIFCEIWAFSQTNLCLNFFDFLIRLLSFTNLFFQSRFNFHNCCFHICRCFETRGSLDRRVNCRRVPQPRWVSARRSAKGGGSRRETGMRGGIPRPSCLSRAQVGCACSRGLQASTREGASGLTRAPSRPFPARPTLCKRALVLPFIGTRRGSRCTMGV